MDLAMLTLFLLTTTCFSAIAAQILANEPIHVGVIGFGCTAPIRRQFCANPSSKERASIFHAQEEQWKSQRALEEAHERGGNPADVGDGALVNVRRFILVSAGQPVKVFGEKVDYEMADGKGGSQADNEGYD